MALNARGYFSHLRAFLSDDYIVDKGDRGVLTIKDKYYPAGATKPAIRKIVFPFTGDAFALNLDMKEKKGKSEVSPALFRFLDDNAKPWSKKCDYVIFHRLPRHIYVYCIELKSDGINAETICAQLDAARCWLQSLKRVIEHYTRHEHPLKVQRFVFSSNKNPAAYLQPDGAYLARDPSIRFYNYDDLDGMSLADLENTSIETV